MILIFVFSSCANNSVEKEDARVVTKPIPTICGKYNVVLGVVQKEQNKMLIDGGISSMELSLKVQNLIGKKVLVYYTMENVRVAGLPYPDGRDSSYERSFPTEAKLMQVVDNGFDYNLIEKKCDALKMI